MTQPNMRYEFMEKGIFIDPMIDTKRIGDLVKRLRPVTTEHELIRIGADADGGYLVPNDLSGLTACFSPGVDDIASFEQHM